MNRWANALTGETPNVDWMGGEWASGTGDEGFSYVRCVCLS